VGGGDELEVGMVERRELREVGMGVEMSAEYGEEA